LSKVLKYFKQILLTFDFGLIGFVEKAG
jgi:hypothetical protein